MAVENEVEVDPGTVEQEPLETPPPDETPEPSLHDALEEAFDAVERATGEQANKEQDDSRPRDPETGRFVEKPPAKPGEKPVPGDTGRAKAAGAQASAPAPAATPAPEPEEDPLRAPQSWRAVAREHWASLPKPVQEELLKREKDVNGRLAVAHEHEAFAKEFQQTVNPYLTLIRESGGTPMGAVRNLLQTSQVLSRGSPWDRATVTAQIIRGFNVNPQLLAAALTGQAPPPGSTQGGAPPPGQQQVQDFRDPRLDAFLAEQQAQKQAELKEYYDDFAKTHEFFEDVRQDMAAYIRVKEAQGVALSDEDAYNMAVAARSDLQTLVKQRAEAARIANPPGSTRRAVAAARTLKPSTAPQARSRTPSLNPLRDDVESAWDEVEAKRNAR